MDDCISREAAIKALTGWETDPTDEEIEYAINNLPSAQPEIVHCKDCKNCVKAQDYKYQRLKMGRSGYECRRGYGEGIINSVNPQNDFCSWAERRAE